MRALTRHPHRRRVALVFASFAGGGLERSMLLLAEALIEQGFSVDLVVGHAEGELLTEVPPEAGVVELGYAPMWPIRIQALKAEPTLFGRILHPKMRSLKSILPMRQLPDLVRYFATVAPDAVLSAEPKYNLLSMWARRVAGLGSRIVLTEHVHALSDEARLNLWAAPHLLPSLRSAYLKADAIVAVSDGLAHHLACQAGIPLDRITTVYNPVVGQDLPRKAREPIDHPWFGAAMPPVVLGTGRLHPQKDFATLIRAFARVRAKRPARLMILGAGAAADSGYAAELRRLVTELGIADDVDIPGFAHNPFAYMSRAAVFAFSSRYEGLGNVLLEAMACGTPVVSTDCPSGPREILDHGRFGALVPVGDHAALARAIEAVLDDPPAPERLRARAEMFTVQRAVDHYLELMFPAGEELGHGMTIATQT
jgi:glycosyltransferase involved in cell wall biosynthesis